MSELTFAQRLAHSSDATVRNDTVATLSQWLQGEQSKLAPQEAPATTTLQSSHVHPLPPHTLPQTAPSRTRAST